MPARKHVIKGRVVDQASGNGVADATVRLYAKGGKKRGVARETRTQEGDGAEHGAFVFTVGKSDLDNWFGVGRRPRFWFTVRYKGKLVADRADTPVWEVDRTKEDIEIRVATGKPPGNGDGPTNYVEGSIFTERGTPASGIVLRLYQKGFGGDRTKLAETTTDERGFYSSQFKFEEPLNLEVWAVGSDGTEVALSKTKFRASERLVLNVVAPTSLKALKPEYERLSEDLGKQIDDLAKLGGAREKPGQRDLTLLVRSTGWDARLIALSATAVKLSESTGIGQEALYGIFRAGLPTDLTQLALVNSGTIEKALRKTVEAGIVSLSVPQIGRVKTEFETFARQQIRSVKAPGTASTYADFIGTAGLTNAELKAFEDAYFAHRADGAELWKKAKDNGVPEAKVAKLRLQGKLGYLTLNSADLASSLQADIGSIDTLDKLVDQGLYDEGAWRPKLLTAAGNDDAVLQAMIPTAYAGTPEERLDGYAADLARKVRLSFPTQVVGAMIGKDEFSLGPNHAELKAPVQGFLKKAKDLDPEFELGCVPVEVFVRDHKAQLFPRTSEENIKQTVGAIKTVQRVYQITPSNESMKILLEQGFTSAHDIVAFQYQVFIDRYGHIFPSLNEARLVYRKAEQVSAVTYSFFMAAKQLETSPGVYALSPPAEEREKAKTELIKHYPTMESLFGSLDFCECEHCRSVLSPAAYLVDLLQFLDYDELVWENFLTNWKNKHGGEEYQKEWTKKPDGSARTAQERKPYYALVERRPDLAHLPLTCENTLTTLPYIDIVNEVLEYFVAKGTLAADASRDTGTATTPELLAEPQNILPDAYQKLKEGVYPLNLPFDLWLETVRGFLAYFEVSFAEVLEAFRTNDALIPNAGDPYGHQSVFVEALGMSFDEYAIFTNPDPLAGWHELYGYGTAAEALAELKSAKKLSRRLGISYKELIQLVKSWFINPDLDALVTLRKLSVEPTDVFRYKGHASYTDFTDDEHAALEQRLDNLTETYGASVIDTREWLDQHWLAGAFDSIVVLADPDTGCNFDATTVRYADGRDGDAILFHKINLVVRLWRRLGWTLEETDRALQAFIPKNLQPVTAANMGAAFGTALVYVSHLREVVGRLKVRKDAHQKLATLWSNLPTTGEKSLYEQIFLGPRVLEKAPESAGAPERYHPVADAIFDHPLGQYLSDVSKRVKHHLLALEGATQINGEDIVRILQDIVADTVTVASALGITHLPAAERDAILTEVTEDPALAPLTLGTVSALYRYGLLAKALKLSVRELVALKSLSGLDPYKQLDADPLTNLTNDYPFVHTIEFLNVADALKDAGLKVADLEYLVQHVVDPIGQYRPDRVALLTLFKSLSAGLRRIDAEHTLDVDPLTINDDVIRQKLALVLAPDAVETFLGMWTGSVVWLAAEDVLPADQLDPDAFASEPDVDVAYDDVLEKQHLSYRGVLLDSRKTLLKADHPLTVFEHLIDSVQVQSKEFFSKFLVDTNLFQPGDYNILFGNDESARRAKLVERLLPFVRHQLGTQHIVQALVAELGADPVLIESLTVDANLLSDPSQPGASIRDAFGTAKILGASATFFASDDANGAPAATEVVVTINSDGLVAGEPNRIARPAGTNSAVFEGYLEVPVSGPYRFFAATESGPGEAELSFEHLVDPIFRGPVAAGGAAVELKAGVPYGFRLRLLNLEDESFSLDVQGYGLPRENIGRLTIYPASSVERARRAHVVLAKSVLLAERLGLTEREVRHFLTHRGDFANINLSTLPTAEDRAVGPALFATLRPLVDYARIKEELGGTDDLIDIFRQARRSHPPGTDAGAAKDALADELFESFAQLARRELATVQEAADALGLQPSHAQSATELSVEFPAFVNVKSITRLWDVLQLVDKLGMPPSAASRWANPSPDFATAQELKSTLRARYDTESWQRVAQSVFDKLRGRQRDALVSFITQMEPFNKYFVGREGIGPTEKLYEFFLIDPGMEPVVQTSRLLLATASVQLFIQRCLLNLEPLVHASTINAKHWQWMKRYRVWEANRKIWMFPENWLEPEFRDDKTHLFEELEGELLQEDISDERAEDAFFNYLKKLESLARLEIVAMYCEEKSPDPDPDSNTLHVIGRTYNQPHNYFYRRYAHQMWTPWEPVEAEIEGDHVAAVMWRGRLHLFWVIFLIMGDDDSNGDTNLLSTDPRNRDRTNIPKPPLKVQVQLRWTAYAKGQWSTRESSGSGHLIKTVHSKFDAENVFVHISKEPYEDGEERAILVHLGGPIWKAFRVVSKNSPPEGMDSNTPHRLPYTWKKQRVTEYQGGGALEVTYVERIVTEDGKVPESFLATRTILGKGAKQVGLVGCGNSVNLPTPEIGALISPFFYQDNLHTFFVEPTFNEVTIEQWEEWVIPLPEAKPELFEDWWWKIIPIEYFIPFWPPGPIGPEGPGWIDPPPEILQALDPDSLFEVKPGRDWVTDPSTILQFDEGFISRGGSIDPVVLDSLVTAGAGPLAVHVDAGGEVSIDGGGLAQELTPEMADAVGHVGVAGIDVLVAGNGLASPDGRMALNGGVLNVVTNSGLNAGALSKLVSGSAFNDGFAMGNFGRNGSL